MSLGSVAAVLLLLVSCSEAFAPAAVTTPLRSARFADNGTGSYSDEQRLLDKLKRNLYAAAAGLNRGTVGKLDEQQKVMDVVQELVANTPDPSPCRKFAFGQSKIAGTWKLLYTNAADVLLLAAAPGVRLGTVRQIVSSDAAEIVNTIELLPPVYAPFLSPTSTEMRIQLSGRVTSDTRITRTLKRIEFRQQSLLGVGLSFAPPLRLDLPFFAQRTGFFDTTFVDDDVWIIRAADGAMYVSVRDV